MLIPGIQLVGGCGILRLSCRMYASSLPPAHSFFWKLMCNPSSTGGPSGELKQAIEAEASPDDHCPCRNTGDRLHAVRCCGMRLKGLHPEPPGHFSASRPKFQSPSFILALGRLQFGSVQALMEKFDAAAAGECGHDASNANFLCRDLPE